jgi:ABC-type uncharacterized transport system substrate-binding protein
MGGVISTPIRAVTSLISKPSSAPAPIITPTKAEVSQSGAIAASALDAKRLANEQGRSSTILTGSLGATDTVDIKKTLLGS